MRAFHVTWFSFCVAFFAWFAAAPLTPLLRQELRLSPADVSNAMLASVAVTVFARVAVGSLCDRFGPRRVYTGLLLVSALPVASLAFVRSAEAFIAARLAIGIVGAAFVVTQYHMAQMFAPRVLGTANALTAGWGNLGGGLAQMAMPWLFAVAVQMGMPVGDAWRAAVMVPAFLLVGCAMLYWWGTQDTPAGDWAPSPRAAREEAKSKENWRRFRRAATDVRTWLLAVAYGICFGVELTIHNVLPLFFVDRFGLGLQQAGLLAAVVGLANVFARACGGFVSDLAARFSGLHGRVYWLFLVLAVEGAALAALGYAPSLPWAIGALAVFALFVNFSTGATYGVVPFVHREAVGTVSGLVAAGGNIGAVLATLLFRSSAPVGEALLQLGFVVLALSPLVLLVRFSAPDQLAHHEEVRGRAALVRLRPGSANAPVVAT